MQRYHIRSLLPKRTLPASLNPALTRVDSPRALPLCWYGVPLLTKNLIEFAVDVGAAVPDACVPGAFDFPASFQRLQSEALERGLGIDFRQVWSTRGPIYVLVFFSNRQYEEILMGTLMDAALFLRWLEYPEEKAVLRWYPDIHEDVSGLQLFAGGQLLTLSDSVDDMMMPPFLTLAYIQSLWHARGLCTYYYCMRCISCTNILWQARAA